MPKAWPVLLIALLLALCPACHWKDPSQQAPTEMGLLEDPNGEMTIDQAASPATASRYQPQAGNRMSLGFCRSALWVRLSMRQSPPSGPWVLEVKAPWMDRVDLFLPNPAGGWLRQSTGLQQPPLDEHLGLFAMTAPADTPRQGYAYLRLQSVLSLNASLRLWPRKSFVEHTVRDSYLYGVLFGIMGAMFLVNLLVFITTRDRAYLLYILYMVSIIAHQLCLQGQALFLPTWLWHLIPEISLMVSGAVFYFGAAFCRRFLNTPLYAPRLDRLLLASQITGAAVAILGLTSQIWWGTWLVHTMAILGPVLGIVAGIKALAQGFRPARFYLAAWVVLLLGCMAWGAWSMGWRVLVPLPPSLITIAAALECVLLSLALADRIALMQRERRKLARSERRYHQLSITDGLTGLYNARYFWSKLGSEVRHAHQVNQPLGLVLLDVDDFKRFNDTYGHTEGDKVLAELGSLLRVAVRPADSACRYGGEEFALVLPGAEGSAAHEVGERVREALARRVFQLGSGDRVTVTASLGTAQLEPGDDARSLVRHADRALYQAKAQGKNQTVCSELSSGSPF